MSKHGAQARRMLHKRGGVTRTRSCSCKVRYSRQAALAAAGRLAAETGEAIRAYPCHFCPSWHVGHQRRGRR